MARPLESDKPFVDALDALLSLRGISQNELARRSEQTDFTATHHPPGRELITGSLKSSYITDMRQGRRQVRPEHMEMIAHICDVDPRFFREYREFLAAEKARRLVAEIGLDPVMEALRNLGPPSQANSTAGKAPGPEATRGQADGGRKRAKPGRS